MANDDGGKKPTALGAWDGAKSTDDGRNQNPTAEKDGTGRAFEPKNVAKKNYQAISPKGTVPVKRQQDTDITVTVHTEKTVPKMVPLDRNDITLEEKRHGLTVLIRIEDEQSKTGIDGGRISRLTVTEGKIGEETIHAHFENGEWDREAETFAVIQAVMESKKEHNGLEEEPTQEISVSRDDSRRRDRPDSSGMEI